MNEAEIDRKKEYSLSKSDINDLLHRDTNIYTTQDLDKFRHIDEIFDPLGRCIILYLTENDHKGHWISLIKKGNIIEYYDPYGSHPLKQGETLNVDKDTDLKLNGDNKLIKMIKGGGYIIKYNPRKSQEDKVGVNTCGRHTVFRTLLYKLPMEKYNKLLDSAVNKDINTDDLITYITENIKSD